MTSNPELQSSNSPTLPLFLFAFALGLFGIFLWRSTGTSPTLSSPAPKRCSHWLALKGALRHPRVMCWRPTHRQNKPNTRRQWRQKVLQSRPLCRLPKLLPLPPPAHQLILYKGNKLCRAKVLKMSGSTRIGLGLRLQINRESARDLAAIPGLSLRLALQIVAFRKQNGAFRSLEELTRVRGIGPKTVRRLTPYLE